MKYSSARFWACKEIWDVCATGSNFHRQFPHVNPIVLCSPKTMHTSKVHVNSFYADYSYIVLLSNAWGKADHMQIDAIGLQIYQLRYFITYILFKTRRLIFSDGEKFMN